MAFIDQIKQRAKNEIKTIVLPEATDVRILEAAEIVKNEGYAKVILVGEEQKVREIAKEKGIDIGDTQIIDPAKSERIDEYANNLYELRKAKGMTEEQAKQLVLDPVYYGMMMVKLSEADGLVSGAAHSTSDTLRPALQILRTAPGTKLVSAFFVMVVPDCEYGANGTFVFADSGLNEEPTSEALSEIAISSSKSFEQLVGEQAKVAMLSYSTYGSAKGDLPQKVINATNIVKQRQPDLKIDGEIELDETVNISDAYDVYTFLNKFATFYYEKDGVFYNEKIDSKRITPKAAAADGYTYIEVNRAMEKSKSIYLVLNIRNYSYRYILK